MVTWNENVRRACCIVGIPYSEYDYKKNLRYLMKSRTKFKNGRGLEPTKGAGGGEGPPPTLLDLVGGGVGLAAVGLAVRFLVGDSVTDPLPDDVGLYDKVGA
mmetsp:Transcript_2205/g.4686  ORF Transcript_2205/g.4686 Transcript_2205/m.4686 type:complete len:102 (+) Transcript_2205:419-724(+)